jgi:hypothetical protein
MPPLVMIPAGEIKTALSTISGYNGAKKAAVTPIITNKKK